ncbi:MAG: type II secretion system protein [Elusimicrobiota bacterium]
MKNKKAGYTLIELMIVVALISILLGIAVPKLVATMHRSKEGATKTNLSNIRAAIQVFYADNEGVYPEDDLVSLTARGKYMNNIPVTTIYNIYHHPTSSKVELLSVDSQPLSDTAGWVYVSDRAHPRWGSVFINCTHPDLNGMTWSQF